MIPSYRSVVRRLWMFRWLIAVVVGLLCLVLLERQFQPTYLPWHSAATVGDDNLNDSDDDNYVLVWSDEFDSTSMVVDHSHWFVQTQVPTTTTNSDPAVVVQYTNRINNAYMADGKLFLGAAQTVSASKEKDDEESHSFFTSARLNSKFAFTYGRVEIRAKMPSQKFTIDNKNSNQRIYWQPAIWFLGKSIHEPGGYWFSEDKKEENALKSPPPSDPQSYKVPWPYCGEMDLVAPPLLYASENNNNNTTTTRVAVHTPASFGPNTQTQATTAIEEPSIDGFHDYTLIWEETKLEFYVDDEFIYAHDPSELVTTTWPFAQPHYLLLSMDVIVVEHHGAATTSEEEEKEEPPNAVMEIDYVRVYQRESITPPLSQWQPIPLYSAQMVQSWHSMFYDTTVPVQDWNAPGSVAILQPDNSNNDNQTEHFSWQYRNMTEIVVEFSLPQPILEWFQRPSTTTTFYDNFYYYLHLDFWMATPYIKSDSLSILRVELILDTEEEQPDPLISFDCTIQPHTWSSCQVPLRNEDDEDGVTFLSSTNNPTRGQLIVSLPLNDGNGDDEDVDDKTRTPTTLYMDNIFFYRYGMAPEEAGPLPSRFLEGEDPSKTIVLWSSDANRTTVKVDSWRSSWSSPGSSVHNYTISSSTTNEDGPAKNDIDIIIKQYQEFNFIGIVLDGLVDASNMTGIHVDLWSPDIPPGALLKLKLVDFGDDGMYQGGGNSTENNDDSEYEVVLLSPSSSSYSMVRGEWTSWDIPFSEFLGLTSRTNLAQIILSTATEFTLTQYTLYLDHLYFYLDEPTTAAPSPPIDRTKSSVISLFSPEYYPNTTVPVDTWIADWSGPTVVLDETNHADGDAVEEMTRIIKYTGLTWVGVETIDHPMDVSNIVGFHLDLWTPECQVFRVKFTDLGMDGIFQGQHDPTSTNIDKNSDDSEYEIVLEEIIHKEWMSIDIPLSELPSKSNVGEIIFSADWMCSVYLDNLYFYGSTQPTIPAPTVHNTHKKGQIIALFRSSETGDNNDLNNTAVEDHVISPVVDTWAASWSADSVVFEMFPLTFWNHPDEDDGTEMETLLEPEEVSILKYSGLGFVGIETVNHLVNATDMSHFHVHLWTNDCSAVRIRLVDFGSNGIYKNNGGNPENNPNQEEEHDDSEYEIEIDTLSQRHQWISVDIPLTSFMVVGGLSSVSHLAYLVFSALPVTGKEQEEDADKSHCTIFLDNIYFYDRNQNDEIQTIMKHGETRSRHSLRGRKQR